MFSFQTFCIVDFSPLPAYLPKSATLLEADLGTIIHIDRPALGENVVIDIVVAKEIFDAGAERSTPRPFLTRHERSRCLFIIFTAMNYFFLYKPYGMLSQFTPDHEGQVTLADLDFAFSKDVYPVGRLDADSEGLLLLTEDKSLNAQLLNPKRHYPKTYWVQVEGLPGEPDLDKLRLGVTIKIKGRSHRTRPVQAVLLPHPPDLPPRVPPIRFRKSVPDSWLEITLTEGKNRQVRRMCAAVGFPVLRLVRAGIGSYRLGTTPLGDMSPGEVKVLDRFRL